MKHSLQNLTIALCGLVAVSSASAQSVVLQRTNAEDSTILSKTRPQSPKEIPVPKFVVKTTDNNFMMTIGGQVNPIIGVDLGNNLYKQPGAGISFVTQAIPVPALAGHKSDSYINPLNAAIDFQIVGMANTDDAVSAYIKFGTNGISNNLHMSRAYVSWRGFTAGLKLTLMQDDYACQPPTIDPEGPSGCLSSAVYEVNYTSKDYDGFKFAIGLDMPTWYSSNGIYRGHDYPKFDGKPVANYADAENVIPDIPMWIQYGTDNYNRIRLSGMIRNFAYRDLVSGSTNHMVGWGAMLSGNLTLSKPLIFYYQAAYGQGIGAYLQDLAGMPLSFVPDNTNPGKMKASPMMGVNLGFTYNFSPKWQANIMASESRIWDVRDYATVADSDCNYKYALYCAANVFYNINNWLQWGIEGVWGHRQTWDMGGANDTRIQTQFMFTF